MRLPDPSLEESRVFPTRVRPPVIAFVSTMVVVLAMVLYAVIAPIGAVPTPQIRAAATVPAFAYLITVLLAEVIVILDIRRFASRKARALRESGNIPLSPSSLIPYVLSQKRYQRLCVLAASVYGTFYGLLTSVIVYQPGPGYSTLPGLVIPSVQPVQLIGSPLLVPEVTVFVTANFAMILIPLTLILLFAISWLVGVNFALAAFAFDSRVGGVTRGWVGGIGAIVGLFTGCPTCAGLFFASVVGGAGAVSIAALLTYYQPIFIVLSVPVLLFTPYLISRSLQKVFTEGCVRLGSPGLPTSAS